jgi:ubiquinone/menaquinone biosynthesis C-methylase UbiE
MTKRPDNYIPALSFDWLTPLYDPLQQWIFNESSFKRQLVDQAQMKPGHYVLDLGCGSGTLTILAKQGCPAAMVVGLDGDDQILAIAQAKVRKARTAISLVQGMAFELPYPDDTFDRVLTSLVFHHLTRENKYRTAQELFRIIRPGGELHIADFGKPHNLFTSVLALLLLHFEQLADNLKGLLPEIFHQAGFEQVEITTHHTKIYGSLALYRARKPGSKRPMPASRQDIP